MSGNSSLDPYTEQAQNNDVTTQEKIAGLKEIIKSTETAMLTSRSSDGSFHSRAMSPVHPHSETDLTLTFFANSVSHKFEEIEHDSHVNVSFLNPTTTSWASFSGRATVTQDPAEIKKYWSTATSAWFGDLKDGIHKGDSNDPRVALIQVVPDEIRYWYATKGKVGRAIEIGVGAMTGKTSTPGELRTITSNEIKLTQGLHTK
ncbi:Protein bli-3 [Psilocybe cubensis]|uniref:Protein bli-3 n=1 Tax=Psilocybe cubensis TaxID=181762 RepID=A0ACB8HE94_PSICU|nr:Protein bli-3 [Psilocybe cubensis]KAH9485465.1 Protein bli-3 [Psilocybe cubensis]